MYPIMATRQRGKVSLLKPIKVLSDLAEDNKLYTYVSLFSSAGVGCYGFQQAGFKCIATSELIERRIAIQRFNQKCSYESGYICGDITKQDVKERILGEILQWNHSGWRPKLSQWVYPILRAGSRMRSALQKASP